MIKRRQFLRFAQLGLIASLGTGIAPKLKAAEQTSGLTIEWLGHSCFLFSGSGLRVLVNPLQQPVAIANDRSPLNSTDLFLIRGQLSGDLSYEELPGRPKLLSQAGAYNTSGLEIQGIQPLKTRNIAWKWTQGDINILHLGEIASALDLEQQILMGTPDVLLVPIGGSENAFTPEDAKKAIEVLKPKIAIPMHCRMSAPAPKTYDLKEIEDFLTLMSSDTIIKTGSTSLNLSSNSLPSSGHMIQVMGYV